MPFSGHWAIPCPPRLLFMRLRCRGGTASSREAWWIIDSPLEVLTHWPFKRKGLWFNASQQVTLILSRLQLFVSYVSFVALNTGRMEKCSGFIKEDTQRQDLTRRGCDERTITPLLEGSPWQSMSIWRLSLRLHWGVRRTHRRSRKSWLAWRPFISLKHSSAEVNSWILKWPDSFTEQMTLSDRSCVSL